MENWKKELINAKEKLIYVNYKRGEGATTTILDKILRSDKDIKVLYIGCLDKQIIEEYLKYTFYKYDIIYKNHYIKITKPNNTIIELTYKSNISEELNRGIHYDICISDCVYTIVPEIMCNICEQIIMIMPDSDNLKIINSNKILSEQKSKLSIEKQIELQKIKLLKELDELPCQQSTTITREKLINMLSMLDCIGN